MNNEEKLCWGLFGFFLFLKFLIMELRLYFVVFLYLLLIRDLFVKVRVRKYKWMLWIMGLVKKKDIFDDGIKFFIFNCRRKCEI